MPATPITLAYGDGIGFEVMEAALRLLQEAEAELQIEIVELGAEVFKRGGTTGIPQDVWEPLRRARVLLKAPIAMPENVSYSLFLETLEAEFGVLETTVIETLPALPAYTKAVIRKNDSFVLFEANHGAAPDIAGKNIADPTGLMHAAILLLVHLEQYSTANFIHNALLKTLEDGINPAEIGTAEFAEAIVDRMGLKPEQHPIIDYKPTE